MSVPFKWYPKEEILPHAAAWRLLDLSESNGRPIDLVIASKFPTYFVRHPHKVAWLIHQYRAAYELCGTPYSDFGHNETDVGLRDTLIRLDTEMLGECRAIFANARNTAKRLDEVQRARRRGAVPSAAAGGAADRRARTATTCCRSAGSNRSSAWTCSVRAMAEVDPPIRLVVAGDGTQRENVERVAATPASPTASRSSGRVERRAAARPLRRGAGGALSAVRRGFRLRHARGVPGAQAGHHLHRFGRPERVRRRRRQRLRVRAGARGARRRDQPPGARPRARRSDWATPATRSRAASPGTASSRSWSADC